MFEEKNTPNKPLITAQSITAQVSIALLKITVGLV